MSGKNGKTQQIVPKKKLGRPPKPIPKDIAREVLVWIANGDPLEEYCAQQGKPRSRTIRDWKMKDPDFGSAYARAREIGGEIIAERMRLIARTPTEHKDDVQHRRLIIDTDKWLLARWFPKHYGDRQHQQHEGGVTIKVETGVPQVEE